MMMRCYTDDSTQEGSDVGGGGMSSLVHQGVSVKREAEAMRGMDEDVGVTRGVGGGVEATRGMGWSIGVARDTVMGAKAACDAGWVARAMCGAGLGDGAARGVASGSEVPTIEEG
jgi:hypothetical protein